MKPGRVVIAGGPSDLVRLVSQRLEAAGAEVHSMDVSQVFSDDPVWMKELAGRSEWDVLNLLGLEHDCDKTVAGTFQLYRMLASRGNPMPRRVLAALATGGSFLLRRGFSSSPDSLAASSGGVCGATKAFQQEFPEVACTVLDMDPGTSVDAKAGFIMEELFRPGSLEVARDAGGRRFGIGLEPVALAEISGFPIAPEFVVFATGGARGITAACIKALLAKGPFRLGVVGTAPEPGADSLARSAYDEKEWAAERQRLVEEARRADQRSGIAEIEAELARRRRDAEIAANLRDFEQAGAVVRYFQANVMDPLEIGRIVQEIEILWGRIDVVIHGAGKDQSKALAKKTLEGMREIYETKVAGFRNLKTALERAGIQPSLWVLFSSVAGRFGNAGQTEYSAANEALNFVARNRSASGAPEPRFLAVNWGPWADVGMAARGGTLGVLRSRGVEALRPQEAGQTFERLLAARNLRADVVVAAGMGDLARVAVAGTALQAGSESENVGGRSVSELLGWFSGRTLEFEPGRRVVFALEPNPKDLEFLDHHRIGGTAVLPGVVALALFAYGAGQLAPGAPLRAFEEVVFEKPLKFHRDRPIPIQVEVSALDRGRDGARVFQASLKSLFSLPGEAGQTRAVQHHKARLVLGAPEPLVARFSPAPESAPSWVSSEEIYKRFFHGPRFRVLSAAYRRQDRSLEARVDTTRRAILAEAGGLLNVWWPTGVEAAFQTAGLWLVFASGRMGLPGRVERICLCVGDGAGARVCAVHRSSVSGDIPEDFFDVDVLDAQGVCVLRLEGLALISRESSGDFQGVLHSRGAESGQEPTVAQEIVSVLDLREALRNRGEDFLREWLAPEEIETFRNWTSETRAWAWLAGRVAAKKAIQKFVLHANPKGEAPIPRTILVRNDSLGRPFCDRTDLLLSISHKEDAAVGAVADVRAADGIGVDLEVVVPRDPAMIEQFFTAGEQALARRLDRQAGQAGSNLHFSHLWAVKEAVLKSLGLGLRADSRQVEVKSIGPDGTAEVALCGLEKNGLVQLCPNDRFRVRVIQENGHVIARSLFGRCPACRVRQGASPAAEEKRNG